VSRGFEKGWASEGSEGGGWLTGCRAPQSGRTPLHLAVIKGETAAFEALLPKANVDVKDNVRVAREGGNAGTASGNGSFPMFFGVHFLIFQREVCGSNSKHQT